MSSFIDLTIDINQTVVIATASSPSLNVGWADVSASGSLEGYAVFSLSPTAGPVSEGTVPLDSRLSSSLVLPYDNTNGSRTGIAIANQSSTPAKLTTVVSDQSGTQIATSQIVLPALGHTSFFVTDQFSQAANRIGVIKFQNPSGNVTGVGVLFNSTGSFTSLPIIQ